MSIDAGKLRGQWQDLLAATEFARERFEIWKQAGAIQPEQGSAIDAEYEHSLSAWKRLAEGDRPIPAAIAFPPGASKSESAAWGFRVWRYIGNELHRHAAAGRLLLTQLHGLQSEVQERLAVLRRRIQDETPDVVVAEPVETPESPFGTSAPEKPRVPRRSLLEILLDPRTIQWFLAFGGALMVLGLVILLYVNEFFTPPVVAIALGAVNGALLVAGHFVLTKSRFQTAWRAITLLACLVMPLNLWYYHANGLVTLDGHLWVVGMLVSGLYALSAWRLKDEMFVHVFMGGVTLTGLLFLADLQPSPQRFWEIASPATLLVVLGLLGIHVERAFPEADSQSNSAFTRNRFGLAFFFSGHVLLASGLVLLFCAQLAGQWLYEPYFKQVYAAFQKQPSPVVNELRWLAFGLVVAGTYAYVYSDIVVRRIGVYVYVAAFTLLWAQLQIVDLLGLRIGVEALIALLAGTSLIVNLLQYTVTKDRSTTRAFPTFGLLLCVLPVLIGFAIYVQALNTNLREVWSDAARPSWSFVFAMLFSAVACRVGAHVYARRRTTAALYFFVTGAATMIAAVAFLAAAGLTKWPEHAPWMMLIPIAYLIASRVEAGRPSEQPLVWIAHTSTVVMLISSIGSTVQGFDVVARELLNLQLALFFAEAALFYGLAAAMRKQPIAVHLGTAMACGSLWQLLTWGGLTGEYYTLTFAIIGLLLLIGYRFAMHATLASGPLAKAAFEGANTLLSLSFVGSILMTLSHLATDQLSMSLSGLAAVLMVIALLAAAIVRQRQWRRWYVVSSIAQALLVFLIISFESNLSTPRKLEIFSVAVGAVLLVVGHIGWYREQDRENDLVSLCLFLGSTLAGATLGLATVIDRSVGNFYVLEELAFLAVSVSLLGSGFILKLKSTTLWGALLTVVYFLTLLIYVPWGRMNTVAVALTVGGGFIFGTGLLLSLYRDRLLTLPERVKRREGLFRVLNWR